MFLSKYLQKIFGYASSKTQSLSLSQIPRRPRTPPRPLHNIAFAIQSPPHSELIPIANISSSGIGFFKTPSMQWPAPGSIIKGELLIQNQRFRLAAKIIHHSGIIVGCEFILAPQELSRAILQYFSFEISAQTLTEVKPEILQREPDGIPHWYRSKDGSELFLVEDGDKIARFYLNFLGIEVEGGAALKTSFFHTNLTPGVLTAPPSELIDAALRFVQSAAILSEQQKKALSYYLKGVPENDDN